MRSPKEKLESEFYEFDFFQAVRVLERLAPKHTPVGLEGPPAEEIARFRAHLSMSFPPSQIVELTPRSAEQPNTLLTVTFLGLYGPSGVLPTHYTQLLMDIQRDVRGPERRSLRDWFDLFNHRFISLFYRAWEKYRFHLPYERGEAIRKEPDPFTLGLQSLMGLGTTGLSNRLVVRTPDTDDRATDWGQTADDSCMLATIDDLALLHYAGFFIQQPRNATNLRALLTDYFCFPVVIDQFRGQWIAIPETNQTRLGEFGTLGVDATAGERVWDVQSRFTVRLGPLSYRQFDDLLPDLEPVTRRKSFFLVAQLVRLFVGAEFDFDLQLILAACEVPPARLSEAEGAGPRLGWTVWLFSGPAERDADEATFDAEWVTVL
jgi:type VI secretion system protein ImpH